MVAPQVEIKVIEVVSSFQVLEGCLSKDGGPQEDMKRRLSEGLNTSVQ